MNYELRSEAITCGRLHGIKYLTQRYKYVQKKSFLKTENLTAGDCYWQCHVIKELALIYVFISPVIFCRHISKVYFVKLQV
jgi:hypothetical protein